MHIRAAAKERVGFSCLCDMASCVVVLADMPSKGRARVKVVVHEQPRGLGVYVRGRDASYVVYCGTLSAASRHLGATKTPT